MEKCVNLNSINDYEKQNYNGYGFASSDNNSNPIVEIGKHQDGRLRSGIRHFKESNTLQMGIFHIDKSISLDCGFKRFANGDICISKKFVDSTKYGLIGSGPSLYIYENGNWCYGKFVRGKVNGSAIFYNAKTSKLYYREYSGSSYQNEQEIDYLDYVSSLNINFSSQAGLGKYNLNYEIFQSHYYTNCDVYAMGMQYDEDGLGYAEWKTEDKYIGEWQAGQRTGLGVYYYKNKTAYGLFENSKITEYRFEIFNTGEIDFGFENSLIPRFTFLPNGDFIVHSLTKYALYINSDFSVSFDEYDESRHWIQKVKTLNINRTIDNNSNNSSSGSSNSSGNSTNKSTTTSKTTKNNNSTATSLDAEKELEELIGLSGVKKELKRIKAYLAKNKGKKLNLHMVFTGSPGTGKTVVARLIGKILYNAKILPKDTFIEASRQTLIGEYVGHTAVKTNKVIDEAIGGVLFIDEAYSLNSHSKNDFGHEAVAELLKKMEDLRGDFCCIMAGYTKEMEDFISMNPGFKSRVQFFINFPNYSKEELEKIARIFLKKNELTASDSVVKSLVDIVWSKADNKDFSNAREVRMVIDKLAMIQSERTINDFSDREIKMEDVNVYINENSVVIRDESSAKMTKMIDYFKLKQDNLEYQDKHYIEDKLNIIESIVAITVETKNDFYESSGFIVSDDGYIVTAAHCINIKGGEIKVRRRVFDRFKNELDAYYTAKICAIDKENDVAIIKIDVKGKVPYLRLLKEYTDNFEPTRQIVILGYPFGVSRFDNLSITEGKIVSYQNMEKGRRIINLDCEAKQGNSGSCVIDAETGRVIGVLSGSHIGGVAYQEEINYCSPIEFVWQLIRKNQ